MLSHFSCFGFAIKNKNCFHLKNVLVLQKISFVLFLFLVKSLKIYLLEEASKLSSGSCPEYIDMKFNDWKILTEETFEQKVKSVDNWDSSKIFLKKLQFYAIVGGSGSGKTTLSKIFLNDYASKKQLLECEYVFYIKFTDINFNKEYNLLQLLAPTLPHDWILDNCVARNILNEIAQNGKTLIIIDHFVTGNINFYHGPTTFETSNLITTGETHIKNLLLGNALPSAKVFVFFRPWQMIELPPNFKYFQLKHIFDLNKFSRKQISQNIFTVNSSLIEKYIEAYPELTNFCNTPSNCFAVMHILDSFLNSNKSASDPLLSFPLTRVFVPSLVLLIWENGLRTNKCDLFCAIKLAWQKFSKTNFCFEKELSNISHTCNMVDLFLQIHQNTFNVSFCNICQDFFVAVYLLYFDRSCINFNQYLDDYLKVQLSDAKTQPNSVIKFMFGLCSNIAIDYYKQLLPFSIDIEDKSKKLTELVFCTLQTVKKNHFELFSNLLFVSNLAFEMQCDSFTKQLANNFFPSHVYAEKDCCARDIAGFMYVLQARETELCVHKTSSFVRECFDTFWKGLKVLPDSAPIKYC